MAKCAICRREVDEQSAPILEMSGYGYTRVLCDECSEELDTATLGTDAERIAEAMDSIGKKMTLTDADPHTFETVDGILRSAMERAKAIKAGEYDFSLDEENNPEAFDEIPEELRESEEDIALDKADEEKAEKVNRFLDYLTLGTIAAVFVYIAWKLIDTFILK